MLSDDAIATLLAPLNNPSLPGIDLSLERMQALLAALGNPQERLPPTVHVAGTNGKGSTLAFLRAMLQAAGKRVHGYTSPHLVRFNERIVLAGKEIDNDRLAGYLQRVAAERSIGVTFFEATTAAAFLAFAEHDADFLLLETGMGGRLDATTMVARPKACIITPIGLDHQEFLGPDLAAVAAEKAGIIKPGVPVFSAAQLPEAESVLRAMAQRCHAPFTLVEPAALAPLGLMGAHQQQNAALAVAVAHALGVTDAQFIAEGLRQVRWPGRLQRLTRGPIVEQLGPFWLDGGHNAHAARVLADWLAVQPAPRVLLCGLMARKDAAAFFAPLAEVVEHCVAMPIPGAADGQDPDVLREAAMALGIDAAVADDLESAVALAQRYNPATVLIAGSLYLAGEILKHHE